MTPVRAYKATRWLVDGVWRSAKELAQYWGLADNGARYRAWCSGYSFKRE